jgi:Protein of unknown function (DUF2914)/Tetratricopeptide repeat
MTQVLDPATMIEAAQTAAATGDYREAERLLCEAAASQEATLGSVHPDLASTLNNLALVYEQTNKIAEAEQSYRRAHAIAVASLLPGHPFVATSLKNLVDFCEARDIPLWRPPAVRSDDIDSGAPAPASRPEHTVEVDVSGADSLEADFSSEAEQLHSEPLYVVAAAEPSPAPRRRRVALVGLAAAAVIVISIVMRWSEASPASGLPAPAAAATASTVASAAAPAIPVDSRPAATSAPEPVDRVEPAEPRERRELAAPVTVLNAQLCSAIEKRGSPDWQCAAANGELQPGTYSFYTRLQANRETTIEHRWYRDDRVHQVIRLRVGANPTSGYRTLSTTTISTERTGNWRVEVRAADGTLLQEERFVVH